MPLSGPSLLVVDDDSLAARYMRLALARDYDDVRCAASGAAALEAVESKAPDVVLTDLRMPSMDGLELLARLRARWPAVAVILVTVEQDVEVVVEAVQRGAVNYLIKPVSPAVLATAVRKALATASASPMDRPGGVDLIGPSDALGRVRELVTLAARSDANVLITGETGTGKELVARAIHRRSRLASGPFVAHNCAVTPADLFESQFFGHRRGAFTGADREHAGLLKEADGGILFLDELECLSPAHQAKLLRVLDDGVVRPVGSAEPRTVCVRVLSATNRSPESMLADGGLREDLYYRLRGLEVRLPPLHQRRGDIRALAEHFLEGSQVGLSMEALDALERYAWPGNVRQLRSVLAGALQVARSGLIGREDLGLDAGMGCAAPGHEDGTLKDLERDAILRALQAAGGNRIHAARALGIHRSTLRRKMDGLGIR